MVFSSFQMTHFLLKKTSKHFSVLLLRSKICLRLIQMNFVGKQVSVIIPVKGNCQQFVIGLERELSLVTWDGISEKPSKIEKIADVDQGTQNRMNDGKCDANGRLWVGKKKNGTYNKVISSKNI